MKEVYVLTKIDHKDGAYNMNIAGIYTERMEANKLCMEFNKELTNVDNHWYAVDTVQLNTLLISKP